jgi:prepilin-type N-terminal cleavage/methylation domain-containing protein
LPILRVVAIDVPALRSIPPDISRSIDIGASPRPSARRLLSFGPAGGRMRNGRGFTLVEVVVAMALVTVVGLSVATALVASRAIAVHDREQAIGRVAAQARLATLTSFAFDTIVGADGTAVAVTDTTSDVTVEPFGPGGTGLRASPADALWRDCAGYVDYLDVTGRSVGAGAGDRTGAAYVRRWAIGRHGADAGEVALVAVLVAPVSTAARVAAAGDDARLIDQPGVVVLRGARVRQAS